MTATKRDERRGAPPEDEGAAQRNDGGDASARRRPDPAWNALQRGWPLLLLLAGAVWAHVDLRLQVKELEHALEMTAAQTAASGVTTAQAHQVGSGEQPLQGASNEAAGANPQSWRCQGSIDAAQVRREVGQQGRAVFACHERRSAQVEGLRGSLVLTILVQEDGQPERVHVDGSIADRELRSCVGEAVLKWRFPPPTGGDCAVVNVPFSLGDSAPPSGNAAPRTGG